MNIKKEERLLEKLFDLPRINPDNDEVEYFYQKLIDWDHVLGWLEAQADDHHSIAVPSSEALSCLSIDREHFNEAVNCMKAVFGALKDGPKMDGQFSFVLNPEASLNFQFFLNGFLFYRDLLSEASPA